MDEYAFRTIPAAGKGQYKEKNSKFLGFAFPVGTEQEVKGILESLRNEYFDARHHCYAWVLGTDGKRQKSSDDGEPSHSAGDPILGQIRSRNLTNVVVVVVRYFGGTKLGVGGLIQAYRTAADLALEDAGVIDRQIMDAVNLEYRYEDTPSVMRLIKEYSLNVTDQHFGEGCRLSALVSRREVDILIQNLDVMIATGSGIRYTRG